MARQGGDFLPLLVVEGGGGDSGHVPAGEQVITDVYVLTWVCVGDMPLWGISTWAHQSVDHTLGIGTDHWLGKRGHTHMDIQAEALTNHQRLNKDFDVLTEIFGEYFNLSIRYQPNALSIETLKKISSSNCMYACICKTGRLENIFS